MPTIFALSSGAPPAAIAVVRISGPEAGPALLALADTRPEPRRASLRALRHPTTGDLLDHALLLWFPGPASATGEDLAELHLHGGRAVVRAVLDALRAMPGLRDAAPGEFTRRAFENGRLDLAEAEGLADLLEAETERARRHALAAAGGALSRRVQDWQTRLAFAAAYVEAELDHDDEGDVPADAGEGARPLIAALAGEMQTLLAAPPAERLREGVRVVLAGPPNSGKSTLLNALAGRDVAIVSDVPGTTRDLVTAPVALDGVALELTDTAGLRDTGDPIEAIGVARARGAVEAADLLLWLGRSEDAPTKAIIIAAKADLRPSSSGHASIPFASSEVETRSAPTSLDFARDERDFRGAPEGTPIQVSAITGLGLNQLRAVIRARADALLGREDELLLNARQRARVAEAVEALAQAQAQADPLLIAEHLRAARRALGALTGHEEVEQMLDALFGRFCIGK